MPIWIHWDMTFGRVPFIATRMRGDVAWITWLYVPPTLRRHGIGRRMVEAFWAHVPPGIREIRLVPDEIDDEDPTPFWEKLGFSFDAEPLVAGEMAIPTMSRTLGTSGAVGSDLTQNRAVREAV